MAYLIVMAVTFVAAGVNAVTGFGFGILSVALFSLVMPTAAAVSLSCLITILLNALLMSGRLHGIQWKRLLIPLPFSLVCSYAFIRFGGGLPEYVSKRVLGLILILLSLYFLFAAGRIKMKGGAATGIAMGCLSGALQGLYGMGGPPMVLYYLGCTEDKTSYMATLQMYFTIVNLVVMGMRLMDGLVTPACWRFGAASLIPLLLATWLGGRVFRRLDAQMLRRISYLFMAVCGVYFVIAG